MWRKPLTTPITSYKPSAANIKPRSLEARALSTVAPLWRMWKLESDVNSSSATPVPADEKTHPVQLSLLGAEAIVKLTNALPNLIQRRVERKAGVPGFMGFYTCVFVQFIGRHLKL